MYSDKLKHLTSSHLLRGMAYIASLLLALFARPFISTLLCLVGALFAYGLFFYSVGPLIQKKARFLAGFFWFFVVQYGQLMWLATPKYQGLYVYGLHGLLSMLLAAQFALFTLWVSRSKYGVKVAVCGASLWTLAELSRLYFLCGFIWNPLGLMLTATKLSSQLAAFFGVYGLSWCVMFIALLLSDALMRFSVKRWSAYLAACALPFVVSLIYLSYQTRSIALKGEQKPLKVALVQTAIYPVEKNFFLKYAEQFVHPALQWSRIWTMVERRYEEGLDLVVLPEAAVFHAAKSFIYDSRQMGPFLRKIGARIDLKRLFKEPYAQKAHENGQTYWWVNNLFFTKALAAYFDVEVIAGFEEVEEENTYASAFFVRPKEAPVLRYDKRVLLPVAEYLPMEGLRNLALRYGMTGFFTPGKEGAVFEGRGRYFPAICYEECFGSVVKEGRRAGGEILVSLNNDAWYPHSGLNYTHFDHGRVRAIENGVYQLRACNTGVTAVVDPFGQTVKTLGLKASDDVRDVLIASLPRVDVKTLYARFGNSALVLWSILTISFYYVFKRRSPKNT